MFFEKKQKQNEEKKISRRTMLKWTGAAVIGGVIGAQTEAKETLSPFEMAEEYTRLQEQFGIIRTEFWSSLQETLRTVTESESVSNADIQPFVHAVSQINAHIDVCRTLFSSISESFKNGNTTDTPSSLKELKEKVDFVLAEISEAKQNPLYEMYKV